MEEANVDRPDRNVRHSKETPMYQATVKSDHTYVYGLAIASLFSLVAADGARAVAINPIPGAITCQVGEPGGVGDDFEGFVLENDAGLPELDIELEGFDSVECGPGSPGTEVPRPLPLSLQDRPVVTLDGVRYRAPGPTDIVLDGRYILGGMYGIINDGVYGVYNLHGVYDVHGILLDATVYNFNRFGDAHPPILVPEPTAALLFAIGLLALLREARRRR
jgi:hypothetical protein